MTWKVSRKVGNAFTLADGRIRVSARTSASRKLSNGSLLTLELLYEEQLERVVVDTLRLERESTETELHTSLLHEIHITDALQSIVLNHMIEVVKAPSQRLRVASDALGSYQSAKGRAKLDVLGDAATIYTIATIANLPPLKTVSEELHISHRTATRRVGEARELGLLSQQPKHKSEGMTVDEADAWLSDRVSKSDG